MGEYELAMLEGLKSYWRCNTSEAIRRSIVYSFCKMVAGVSDFSEESLIRSLQLALEMVRYRRQQAQGSAKE